MSTTQDTNANGRGGYREGAGRPPGSPNKTGLGRRNRLKALSDEIIRNYLDAKAAVATRVDLLGTPLPLTFQELVQVANALKAAGDLYQAGEMASLEEFKRQLEENGKLGRLNGRNHR